MAEPLVPNAVVNVCTNCIPVSGRLPRQWTQDGVHVVVREIPCSGKIDAQYLMHALEGVTHGVCVVACPQGDCHLSQGNCRAEVRVRTVRQLLAEIGLEPERAELLHFSADDSLAELDSMVRGAVQRLDELVRRPVEEEALVAAESVEDTGDWAAQRDSEAERAVNAA